MTTGDGTVSLQTENTYPPTDVATQKTTRRSLISNGSKIGLGAIALSPLLAACGGSSSTSGPVTIQFAASID